MELHIFKCSNRKLRAGITEDSTGNNLPTGDCNRGKWVYFKTIDINKGHPTGIGLATADEILAAISQQGYFINNAEIRITEIA